MDYKLWTHCKRVGIKVFLFLFLVHGPWSMVHSPVFAQLPEGEATLPTEEETQPAQPAPEAQAPKAPAAAPALQPTQPPTPGAAAEEEEKVYLNVQDQDIKEVIKQISKATGRNFIIDAKVTGKVTILSNKMMTKDEAYQAFLSALDVAGFTIVEGPGGILKIISVRDAKNYPIPTHIDTTPLTDSYVTRLIKLDNISANTMGEAIKGLVSRNGNLFAYPETNTLVLTDSGTNIDRLMKIIKELDQEGPQQIVEIIPLHYASAKELAGIVLSLFEEEQKARGPARGAEGGAGEEIPKVSKIIADDRTNSIIVLASKMAIDKVKDLINRLDAKLEEGTEGKIHVYYLKHAKAKDIAEVLQGLAGIAKPSGPPGQAAQAKTGTVVAELEEFKVASEDTTNSLLITATPKTYQLLIDKVITKLDIPRKQVYLEAMIIEFILSRAKAFGVNGHGGQSAIGSVAFGQTFNQLAGLFNPFDPSNKNSAFVNSPGLLGGILSRKRVNIETVDKDGNAKTTSVPAFSAFITALSSFGDTNLIASPSLLALDNEESSIEIKQKEPEPGQLTITGTGLQQQGPPSRVEAGLTLKLTPQITELGSVRLSIDQTFSFFSSAQNTALGTQAIQERKVKTSVVTDDGQTVVIGGLMQDKIISTNDKIPLLGDIPLLGYLFRKTSTTKNKGNLLLFITPHIIRDSSDFSKVLKRKWDQTDSFLSKSYKPKQKSDIETTIKGHNAELFDILGSKPSPGALKPMEEGKKEALVKEPVITTTPEKEEEEAPLTITIPADKEAAKKLEKKAKEEKKAKKETPPEEPPPSHPPVIEIPKKKPPKEAQATPSLPPSPAPPKKGHAPVITLPADTAPEVEE